MTLLKNLQAGLVAAGIFANAWAQEAIVSTAPEPATSPSQAATKPGPAPAPSEQIGPAATVKYSFEMLDTDTDGDGVISRREAAASPDLGANFEQFDRNRDGVLDRSEFVSFSK